MSSPEIPGLELLELIGSGGCGAVYRAAAAGKPCAVKVFSSMAIHRKALAAALQRLQQAGPHRGVLAVEHFDLEHSPYHLIMPLLGGAERDDQGRRVWHTPTLADLGRMADAERAWNCIGQLAEALAWLHRLGVAHGNLRPCNVLLEGDQLRLADVAQGWVGGVHHLELTDHFVHLCPEQAEHPEGFLEGRGPRWDVYSFGVLAYRLLTGRLPRAEEAWAEESARLAAALAAGVTAAPDSRRLLAAVRAQPRISWPEAAASKWEERRRHVLERALDLNPAARWADLREVLREFELIESDRLLEEARAQTLRERKFQVVKLRLWQTVALGLLAALLVTGTFAVSAQLRARQAETASDEMDGRRKREAAAGAERVQALTRERDAERDRKETAERNLQRAQAAVDQLLTQFLQAPVRDEVDAVFSTAQLREALAFIQAALPALEKDPALALERARTYGNLGQIHLRLRDTGQALAWLEKARDQTALLLKGELAATQRPLYLQWLGRHSLLLARLRADRGEAQAALTLLKHATATLGEGLAADPRNRLARQECARAWLDYGLHSLREGEVADAETALQQVARVLDPKLLEGAPMPEEQFLLARSRFAQGLAQREAGRVQEALTTLIDAVTEMGKLVMGATPRNQEQALLLAEAYTELAELLGRAVGGKEAAEAHSQALAVLLELNRLLPEWAEVKYLLARNYGGQAQQERDAGASSEAVKKNQDAIELLNEILADEAGNLRYAALRAKLRGDYAELMADLGKSEAALPIVQQAIASLEELLGREGEARATPERRTWELQLARLLGVLGHTSQTLRKNDEARQAFTRALQHWQKLAALQPGDETIQQGLAWVQDRLSRLK